MQCSDYLEEVATTEAPTVTVTVTAISAVTVTVTATEIDTEILYSLF